MNYRTIVPVLALLLVAGGRLPAAEPLQGLLIAGGCCHDYENQVYIITEGISQRVNITWDVSREGTDREHRHSVYSDPDWADGYDVVVHNECFGYVDDADFIRRIVDAHRRGVAGVFVHCSMHSYRAAGEGADPWRELIGVTSRRHEDGRRTLQVQITEQDHPITRGLPGEWTVADDEMYIIEQLWPTATPLATAYGRDTMQDHVVMWTNTLEDVRTFGMTPGHTNSTMMSSEWLDFVSRGLLWTVDRLNDDGTPAEGYAGTGVQPITLQPDAPQPDPAFGGAAGDPTSP